MKDTKVKKYKVNKIKEEELDVIRSYYLRIWAYLSKNDFKSATNILYAEMPMDLYDTSIDILDNRNNEIYDEELKHLITKVDNILNAESIKELELPEDNFNNQF